MARPRKREFRHLPDFLYYDKSAKCYRFILVNGVRKSVGTDKAKAIAIAREYNNIMRQERAISVTSLTLVVLMGNHYHSLSILIGCSSGLFVTNNRLKAPSLTG